MAYGFFEVFQMEEHPSICTLFNPGKEGSRDRAAIIHILTRGYIANFTLPDFRTKRLEQKGGSGRWICVDGSDEPGKPEEQVKNEKKRFNHQLIHYSIAFLVNAILISLWYSIDEGAGYFECKDF